MRIVFIHTPMPVIAVDQMQNYWRNFDIQYHGAHPGLRHMKQVMWELPHWIPWLAGVIETAGFRSIDVIDFYSGGAPFAGIDRALVHERLKVSPGDVFLFSPMTPNLTFAYEIAEEIKVLYPQSTVVFGGVVATPLAREVASHPAVDFVVIDRGERALPALLRSLRDRTDPKYVGNLVYRLTNSVVSSPDRYPILPASEIPYPKIDVFPRSDGENIRYLRQVYGLGCPFTCDFCTIQTIGRKPSYFAIDRVLQEIDDYRAYYGNHHNIYWGDETFTLNAEKTHIVCDALASHGGINYDCQTRLGSLGDASVISDLARSGCRWIEIGIETANQHSLDRFKQRVRLDETEEVLTRLRDSGIAACSYLVNGFPDQSISQMKKSIDWICELIERDLLQASYLFGLVPFPGSMFFHRPESYGMRIHHRDFKYYNEELPPVFDTGYASSDEIYSVYLNGLVQLSQAMNKRPYFGSPPNLATISSYGDFWAKN